MPQTELKNKVRKFRHERKLEQAELAEKVHVSRQTIHAVETGSFVPSVVLALKIARFFETDVQEIFGLEMHNS